MMNPLAPVEYMDFHTVSFMKIYETPFTYLPSRTTVASRATGRIGLIDNV